MKLVVPTLTNTIGKFVLLVATPSKQAIFCNIVSKSIVEVAEFRRPSIKKSYHKLKIGDYLFDMHYQIRLMTDGVRIQEAHKVTDWTQIPAEGGSEFIQSNLRKIGVDILYLNKMLVIMDSCLDYDNGNRILKCAYSYDDRTFGLVTIEVTINEK